MDFRILGPIEVVGNEGPLPLGSGRPRALLAALLVHPRTAVPADRLVDLLWGEQPPATAPKMVQIAVSELRKTLGRERVRTEAGGYALRLDPDELDAARFERLAAEGREALARGEARVAAEVLRRALDLWRGPALADVAYESFALPEIARLEEERLAALEDRIEAELALGGGDVGELEALTAAHPLRERLHAQLMLALYRAGRQADALAFYQQTRQRLVDQLGIEPGPELRRLERAILAQDPALEAARAAPELAERTVEARKTVTAVFVALRPEGRIDPEALAARLRTGRASAVAALERCGAWVELVGPDEVVGLFGVPRVREDDALRAARAALELREELRAPLALATGEIVTGEGSSAAALRPELAPAAGEILLGEATERLLRQAAVLEPAGEGVWRLISLAPDAPAVPRRSDAQLVGRRDELARLRSAFERAAGELRPSLVSVLGAAGIGKSRLAAELDRELSDDARVLWGRCPPSGQGDALRPFADVVAQAFGDDPWPAIAALVGPPEGELVADRLAAAAGLETAWAARKLLEALAEEGPLVVVLDDLQWAEPTLLDLVEHVAALARDVPLLLLCLARSELVEDRPGWGGGGYEAQTMLLEPLSGGESETLVARLGRGLDADERARIVAAAEGNPLFIEQMLAMAAEGEAVGAMPPTIQALLAARLDRLPPDEREALQRASLIGRGFDRGALAALCGPAVSERLDDLLTGLVRKSLLRPEGRDAYRFGHQLIRDAAYASLPKRTRAELHERLAGRVAGDEVIGYHLEQAAGYAAELGRPDAALARRASRALAAAGRRAYASGDAPVAAGLIGRAVALLGRDDGERLELLPVLADVQRSLGDADASGATIEEAIAAGDERVVWHARVARLRLRLRTDAALRADELLREADEAIAGLGRFADERGLAEAWAARSWISWLRCRAGETADAALRSIEHARRAGDDSTEARSTQVLLGTILFGPTPVAEGIHRCEEELAPERPLLVRATAFRALAGLTAMAGRFDEARRLLERDAEILHDLGLTVVLAHAAEVAALVELLAGRPAEAERRIREALAVVAPIREMAAPTFSAMLARALAEQGKDDETLAASEESERAAAVEDLTTQVQWRGPRAVVLARRGRHEEAVRVAREAVAIADRTDFPVLRADALVDLARVLGSPEPLARARELYEAKGNVAAAARAGTEAFVGR